MVQERVSCDSFFAKRNRRLHGWKARDELALHQTLLCLRSMQDITRSLLQSIWFMRMDERSSFRFVWSSFAVANHPLSHFAAENTDES
jgi:hypothetical protein